MFACGVTVCAKSCSIMTINIDLATSMKDLQIILLLTLAPLLPTRIIWTLADEIVTPSSVCSEQAITVLLTSVVVLSVKIMEFSGGDLEIFKVVEFTDIGVVVILVPSAWNALVIGL